MKKRIKGKRVLVVGGCGFIGTNLVHKLLREGADVTILDNFSTAVNTNFGICIHGNVSCQKTVDDIVKGQNIVFNLAVSNINVCSRKPLSCLGTNVKGTINLLLAAKRYNIERLVQASSASVYGNPRFFPINEDERLDTLSLYAASKLSAESYCMAFIESFGLRVTILRYSNVYGPWQDPRNPYCGVVSKFFDAAFSSEPFQIHDDGDQTRDFTFVEDVVEATLLAAENPLAIGEVFNVSSGKETTINELSAMIADICNMNLKKKYIPKRDIDNVRRRVLNVDKIRKKLRWVPMTSLRDGLAKTREWMIERNDVDNR